MSNLIRYFAFGLVLDSEFPIPQVPIIEKSGNADVAVRRVDMRDLRKEEPYMDVTERQILLHIPDIAVFRMTDGNLIEVSPYETTTDTRLAVYIMGSCMGAILHERGYMMIHGSCVTNGKQSIIISGNSGAGKSTLAAEFLSHGWKLVTDDVSAIKMNGSVPVVVPSYPSQKLWQDSLSNYERKEEEVHSLYTNGEREKYGVHVLEQFCDHEVPLTMYVRLIPDSDEPTAVYPIENFARVDQLMRNTYRQRMIADRNRSRHFQNCVNLSMKIQMLLAVRNTGEQTQNLLYELIKTEAER